MKKEFKVNGKVTYPQGVVSRTTYTLIDDVGNMINLNADTDTDFDYGDAVIMTLTKKSGGKADTSEAPTTVDPVSGSVTTNTASTATTGTTADTASTNTAKPDAATAADTTDTGTQTAPTAATETETK